MTFLSDESVTTTIGSESGTHYTLHGQNEDGKVDLNTITKLCAEIGDYSRQSDIKREYLQWRGTAFTPKSTDHAIRHILKYFKDFIPEKVECKVVDYDMLLVMHLGVRRFKSQPQFQYEVKKETSDAGQSRWYITQELRGYRRRKSARTQPAKKIRGT